MYGIIYLSENHKNQPHVGKYTLDGSYGIVLRGIFLVNPCQYLSLISPTWGTLNDIWRFTFKISGNDVNLIQLIYKYVHVFRSNKYFEVG